MADILVTYASRYGATREIAEAIGRVLRDHQLEVAVHAADEVIRLAPYRAVVLGSGLYGGAWLEEAVEFLESFQDELRSREVWLFSSGPTVPGDPVEAMGGWVFPEDLQPLAERIGVRDIALFGGKIDVDRLGVQDWLINRSMRGVSGDFRDWDRIEAWALEIAGALEPQSVPSLEGV